MLMFKLTGYIADLTQELMHYNIDHITAAGLKP